MYFWYAYNTTTNTSSMSIAPCVEFDGLGTHKLRVQLLKDSDFSIQINYDDEINFYLLEYNKSKKISYIVNDIYTMINKNGINNLPDYIKITKNIHFKMTSKYDDIIDSKENDDIYYNSKRLSNHRPVGFIEVNTKQNEFRFNIVHDTRGKEYFYATHPSIEL